MSGAHHPRSAFVCVQEVMHGFRADVGQEKADEEILNVAGKLEGGSQEGSEAGGAEDKGRRCRQSARARAYM